MSKKQELLASCKVQPYDIHRFILLEDFEYNGYKVPKGYMTNGADIPRLFWFLYPPNRPDYLPAAIIHDYLCDQDRYEEADKEFKSCLKDLDIGKFVVTVFHSSTVSYHTVRYKIPSKFFKNIKYIKKDKK